MPHPARGVDGTVRQVNEGCSRCDKELRRPERPSTEQRDGPVRAIADTRTFTVCDEHSAARDVLRTAVLTAVDARLTFAVRQRRTPRCAACRSLLDLPMRATTRALTIEPTDGAPFTVTLGLPMIRCGECGTDNVPERLQATVRRCALAATAPADAHDMADGAGRHAATWRFSRRRRPDGPRSPEHA